MSITAMKLDENGKCVYCGKSGCNVWCVKERELAEEEKVVDQFLLNNPDYAK